MTTRARASLLALVLVQLIPAALFVIPWGSIRIAGAREFETVPAASTPLTIESGADVARGYATQWNPSARLVSVAARLSWRASDAGDAIGVPGEGWITYVFFAGGRSFSVTLDRSSGGSFSRVVGDWGADTWPELDLTTYPLSSNTAILTAEVLAGQAFRNECFDQRRSATLMPSQLDGVPVWTIAYREASGGNDNAILIRVDAVTGEVLTRRVESVPCDGGE